MAYRLATDLRVKERDEVDRCRYCARPTWSFRRCCVRCKRDGKSGPGLVPSVYSPAHKSRIGVAFLRYWLLHVTFSFLLAHVIATALNLQAVKNPWGSFLLLCIFEGALEGFGFLLAVLLSPRATGELRFGFYLLSAGVGSVCAVLLNALLFNAGPPAAAVFVGMMALLVIFSAIVTRVVLSFAMASHLIQRAAPQRCEICGHDLSFEAEPICPDCD